MIKLFLSFLADELRDERPELIISRDYNCWHAEIDLYNLDYWSYSMGSLPEERVRFSQIIKNGFVDSFQTMNPN